MLEQNDVITIPITYEMKLEALEQEKLIEEQKKNSKETRNLNPRRHFFGALGQIIVRTYFEQAGIKAIFPQYFDKHISLDKCDFIHRDLSVDVKTSPGDSSLNGFVFVNLGQKPKKLDYYCFVKLDKERQEGNILGVVDYDKFWTNGSYRFTPRMKAPAQSFLVEQLDPMRGFVYGV